jgi:hypothetical protein
MKTGILGTLVYLFPEGAELEKQTEEKCVSN